MTTTHSRTEHPLTAWRTDPQYNTQQLTHAVSSGRTVAYCGVRVSVFGDPWPEPGVSTPLAVARSARTQYTNCGRSESSLGGSSECDGPPMSWIHADIDAPGSAARCVREFWQRALRWPHSDPWPSHPELRSFEPPSGTA